MVGWSVRKVKTCTYHFIEKQFTSLLLSEVHHLDSDAASCARVGGSTDYARATLADLTEPAEGSPRITLANDQPKRGAELNKSIKDKKIIQLFPNALSNMLNKVACFMSHTTYLQKFNLKRLYERKDTYFTAYLLMWNRLYLLQ